MSDFISYWCFGALVTYFVVSIVVGGMCGDGKVGIPIWNKGIYCVAAERWKQEAGDGK